ncbi:C39 family peptidase [Micromonospora inositola]|uniref:Peptidase_C39 like family protein n=1 Tax=Micromonospora inositola TaxID=47865 RepID=A0A1C5HGK7_9ACTN|nr:C39 family peptidase [Micromonospora inositola]SCG45209.1 Peptidase_C39 like family protein [Micromonospora inositola]
MYLMFRNSMLSVAGLIMSAGVIAGAAVAAQAAAPAQAKPVSSVKADKDNGKGNGKGADKSERRANYQYEAQPNFFYCGPTATAMALSAEGKVVSLDEVAQKLGTTENGTDSAFDVTRVLNEYTGGKYKTTELRDDVATKEQVERLREDVKTAVDAGRPVVANAMGTALDIDGVQHGFPGHYVTVVEYKDDGNTVMIADPASPNEPEYWMDVTELANWIAGRGYSS